MVIDGQKKAAREAAYARRAAVHGQAKDAAQAAAMHVIDYARDLGHGRVVAAYLPMRSEIDPRPAMLLMHAKGHRICVPVIQGTGLALRFREWKPGCVLLPGPFGTAVPSAGDWLVPGLLLVPLLAFDRRLHRLGYGGGFYDRTLAQLRHQGSILAAGFAYAAQQVAEVPVGANDQVLDALITEEAILRA